MLQKQNYVDGAKNVFGNFQKHFFAFMTQILCVFNLCCLGMQTREHFGNTEEMLTMKASRMFPHLRTHAAYAEDAKFASRKQTMFCFLPVCSPKQQCKQRRHKMLPQQCFLVCTGLNTILFLQQCFFVYAGLNKLQAGSF